MTALYRKYRPKDFSEVIGQEHVVTTLKNAIEAGNISHAYLFCGPRGSGKTSIARLFAKAINCQKPLGRSPTGETNGAEPCNKCVSCEDISAGKAIDLVEIDAASHRGIDDVRQLKEGIKFAPVSGKYKIFIIDECHQLSKDASNALLKTLEEPPSHAIFILATTEANKMIATIVSRCQRFDFKKLQAPELIEKLKFIAKKEKITVEEKAFSLIALQARGSFRDAESLLEKCIVFSGADAKVTLAEAKELLGVVEITQVAQFFQHILSNNSKEAVLYLNFLVENSVDLQEFVKTLLFYLHTALMLKLNPTAVTPQNSAFSAEELQGITQQVQAISEGDIARMLEAFVEAEAKMKYANILQLPLELAVVGLVKND